MSLPTKSVLLPKVFPLSLVNLGQLLPNPLNPSFNSGIPERPITEDDYSKLEESEYATTLTLEKSGKLKASFTKLFGAFFGVRTANAIGLYAPMAFHLELKQPDVTFRKVVQEPEIQVWSTDMAQSVFPTVPGVPGRVGTDGRARRPSFIKTAVLWVDGRALQSYWERDLPVGPGHHLDGLTSPTGPWRHLQGLAVDSRACQLPSGPGSHL